MTINVHVPDNSTGAKPEPPLWRHHAIIAAIIAACATILVAVINAFVNKPRAVVEAKSAPAPASTPAPTSAPITAPPADGNYPIACRNAAHHNQAVNLAGSYTPEQRSRLCIAALAEGKTGTTIKLNDASYRIVPYPERLPGYWGVRSADGDHVADCACD